MRLINDIDQAQIKKVFDVLREETKIFEGFSADDVLNIQNVMKVLQFKRNDYICKKGEEIDFFGIVIHGQAFVSHDHQKLKVLGIGDMIGFMSVSELTMKDKHKYDIIAETDGLLAVLAFGEIKQESRKFPSATYKCLEVAARKSLEVFHYNVFGHELNPAIKHTSTAGAQKKVREFFLKNQVMKAFLKGIDRKDEKHILNSLKTTEYEPSERLIRKGTRDRSIIFIAVGQFIAFKDHENEIYKEGAILGVDEFIQNKPWPYDILCSQGGFICKLTYESLLDLINQVPITAIKLYRRIIRHQCYTYIYQHKLDQKKSFDFFHVDDEDLFIDLKLNYQNEREREIQILFNKPQLKAIKGQEFETMPFFLSDEFKNIMNEKQKQLSLMSQDKDKFNGSGTMNGLSSIGGSGGGSQLYKCEFLKEKINEQNERRKRERKLKKTVQQKASEKADEKAAGGRKRKEGQEDLEEVVDDLKNDLRVKEQEFEELKEAFAKMEAENKRLRQQLAKEKSERTVIEGKLKKTAIHDELKENAKAILANTFFEQKRSKLASLNSTLLSTINEQYKTSLRNSFVAKYAHRWLVIVRERKKERESKNFFQF